MLNKKDRFFIYIYWGLTVGNLSLVDLLIITGLVQIKEPAPKAQACAHNLCFASLDSSRHECPVFWGFFNTLTAHLRQKRSKIQRKEQRLTEAYVWLSQRAIIKEIFHFFIIDRKVERWDRCIFPDQPVLQQPSPQLPSYCDPKHGSLRAGRHTCHFTTIPRVTQLFI